MDKKDRFIRVVKKNNGLIFKVATLYTNTLQDREDLVQEIIFQVWKSFDTFNEQSKISTWMYRVAMNTAIYSFKSSKRQVNTIPIDLEAEQFAEVMEKSEEERIKMLYEQIHTLSVLEKGIILLYLEGKNHQEIASIIGITTSNVGTRISRIREKLKEKVIKTY